MSEDQEIMNKIAQLAGQINRRKNEDTTAEIGSPHQKAPYSYAGYSPRGGYFAGGGGRGRGGGKPTLFRNKTLVLSSTSAAPTAIDQQSHTPDPQISGPSFIAKTGRHRQLINTTIFAKDNQKRVKAFEASRIQKLKHRDEREKLKLHKRLHFQHAHPYNSPSNTTTSVGSLDIYVDGIKFRIVKNGSKLVKDPGDQNAARHTPKTALIQGVRFHRSKSGNMYRSGFIKAYRKPGAFRKVDELCKPFNTTGSCPKGPRCRYLHDPSTVAACREFLQKGICPSGDVCDLSHDMTPERAPTCLHFSKGNCSHADCRYTHVRVSPTAPVCRDFGIYGYCKKGLSCAERHVNECPDFSNTGVCHAKGCKLLHRERAAMMRNNTAAQAATENDSDLESDDEEDEIGSDDVDSDDLEELFDDEEGTRDEQIPKQQDFVQLA